MKNLIKRLDAFDKDKKCINVVVETPKGSRVKYAYEPKSGLFLLKRALPEGMMFPFNFGFIPGTIAEDGDPLDILILNEEALVCGCLVKTRLIGLIEAEQTDEDGAKARNDRLIGLALPKESPTSLESVRFDKKVQAEIEFFFKAYNKLAGKKFKVLGQCGEKRALEDVHKGVKAYHKDS
ncbi:MAG TPA: inorganic diphosphatase [Verrucomicrobiae bacterium]|nr:inorganic diphosphatase [Verrucomicrobiae bacterium]